MSKSRPAVVAIEHQGKPFYFAFADSEDHIMGVMRETGSFYELGLLRALGLVLRAGDLVLDVGANVGTHAVYFAGTCGCRVTAFEPIEATARLLRENCRINGLDRLVEVQVTAVGARAGHAKVTSSNEKNSGATRLVESTEGELPLIALDDQLSSLGKVKVLKIDVEGMEIAVLEGAAALLERDRPVVACECLERKDFDRISELMDSAGYVACNVFNASPTYVFLPIDELTQRSDLLSLVASSVLTVRDDTRSALRLARAAQRAADDNAKVISQLTPLLKQTPLADAVSERVERLATALEGTLTQRVEELRQSDGDLVERIESLRRTNGELAERVGRIEEIRQDLEELAVGTRIDALETASVELRDVGQQSQARLATLSDDVVRGVRSHNTHMRQLTEAIEALRVEHSLLAKEMQRRMARAERRHDKLLDGRVFGTLRKVKALLQRVGLMRSRPSASTKPPSTGTPRSSRPAAAATEPQPASGERRDPAPALVPANDTAPRRGGDQTSSLPVAAAGPTVTPREDTQPKEPIVSLPRPDKVRIAGVPYMSRPLGGAVGHLETHSGMPLLSVVMTSFNTGPLIEPAIRSILDQTWVNLELIVVDDCSTDDTREIVQRLAASDSRLKLYCFGDNRGTYFCKNFGITRSQGVAVTFMDSDDTSDPARLQLQFESLNRPGIAVSTCNHIRVDTDGKTISINGITERIAYISQMIKRSVIREVGYFDTVRTSADDEILRRIKATYGPESHSNVKRVLYTALLRDGSLTRDPDNAINFVQPRGENQSFLSPQRRHYAAMVTRWHEWLAQKNLRPYMPFPVVRRPFPVFGKLVVSHGRYDDNMISVCLASYPPRRDKLQSVVEALLPQADHIFVYLNEYTETPDFLRHSRITVQLGGQGQNLRDNGKFYFMPKVPSGFVFTVDDDIVYPPDYVQTLIRKLEFYERRAVVGLHGTIFAKPIRTYFRERTVYHFEHELAHDVVVNQLGTGTVAFHTDLVRPDLAQFRSTGMADVWLAMACRKARVPMVAIERPAEWMKSMGVEEKTLFREFREDDSRQTKLVKSAAPWDERIEGDIGAILSSRERQIGEAYRQLLPRPAAPPVTEATEG